MVKLEVSHIQSDCIMVSGDESGGSLLFVLVLLLGNLGLPLLLGDELALLSMVLLELLNGDLTVLEGEVEEHVRRDWRGTEALDLSDLGVVKLELEVTGDLGFDVEEAISKLEVLDEVLVLLRSRHTIGESIGIVSLSVAHLDILLRNGLLGDWVCDHVALELEVWAVCQHVLHFLHLDIEMFDKARPSSHCLRFPVGIFLVDGSPERRLETFLGVVDDI